MKIKSFLKALHPETYVRIVNSDDEELALNQAESIIKHGNPNRIIIKAYPECSPLTAGRLAITVVIQDA